MSTSKEYGFTFNGHHSSEFGLKVLNTKSMVLPAKTKTTVQVPYQNGLLDLSDLYGSNTFGERTITFPCRLDIGYNDRDRLYNTWTRIVNWLMSPTGKRELDDDVQSDFFYKAEVQTAPTISEMSSFCYLTIEFQAYPYRFRERADDLWDPFNFDWDVAQRTTIDVNGVSYLNLINNGETAVTLMIDADSDVALNLNGEAYSVAKGSTNNDEIMLNPGENSLMITGNAHVTFDWFEEVI